MNDDQTRPSNSALALPHTEAFVPDETCAMSDNNSNSGGNESEEEYEIERILNHQEKRFGRQRGYFVKWKGYGEADNSWVAEEDAANAKDLITEYWDREKEKKAAKSGSASTASIKRGRKSEPRTASEVSKKRARSTKAVSAEPIEVDEEPPAQKKKRQSKGAKMEVDGTEDDEDGDADLPVVAAMDKKYRNLDSWEDLIASIETVEQHPDNPDGLMVYVTLKDGRRVRETSATAREKFPQLLIDFYESNLRWKTGS
ncbi:hypothetical protein K525DRAFT_281522 [Schizophyllum commune Loenen D]|nr:hypothetical protein K525DRAFT_281522 [Schizophyllum commune Loenen D]